MNKDTAEININTPAIVMFSSNPLIVKPIKKICGKDFVFNQIKTAEHLQKFLQTNKRTDIAFIVDVGNSCCNLHISVAKQLQKRFAGAKRIATGANDFEPAKLRDYHGNACNIAKNYDDLLGFISQIKSLRVQK